ncbi:MAG: hypothetical protein LBR27_01545 [Bifidobacteriaceae bacterium]|jgi:hypothetical protein|nr:hypothetical protein [Bifidobacteriaceae bacterium]
MGQAFDIYLIHSTHTDIGYTDTQVRVRGWHADHIRQAVRFCQRDSRFRWNCETWWGVQAFLGEASPEETEQFVKLVQQGQIGLSASYFNQTDLIPGYVLREAAAQCQAERRALGIAARSAMTADINGYSWGFADILAETGTDALLSSVHNHHGYHPLFRRQTPFLWRGPQGGEVLVWNGEHYHLGNELGIACTPSFEYVIRDGLDAQALDPFAKSLRRLRAYVDGVKAQGYEYDFMPVCLSAHMTDNSSPSLAIVDYLERYGEEGHADISLQMATLDQFFDVVRERTADLPVLEGDWTDWWADGMGSTPDDVAAYREAARRYHVARKLDPERQAAPAELYDDALHDLMLYGEHTWSHSSAMSDPSDRLVRRVEQGKRLYALRAAEETERLWEALCQDRGQTAAQAGQEPVFRAVNPHAVPYQGMTEIDVERFEGHERFAVVEADTGQPVPFQLSPCARGQRLCVQLDLQPGQTKTFALAELEPAALPTASLTPASGTDGVRDLAHDAGNTAVQRLETDRLVLAFSLEHGLYSLVDKRTGAESIDQSRGLGAFTPVHEVTPAGADGQLEVRRKMGRNRKSDATRRTAGQATDWTVLEDGDLFTRVRIDYQLPAMDHAYLIVTLFKLAPRATVEFRCHKHSLWDPENLYLALPFAADTTYVDKAAAVVRPRLDQLPGTCVDYYAVQNAVVFSSESQDLVLCTPDAPLVAMGPLAAHPIRLMGEGPSNDDAVWSWAMNNYWETNFKAELGGFHSFRYDLVLADDDAHGPAAAFAQAEAINEGVLQFQGAAGA